MTESILDKYEDLAVILDRGVDLIQLYRSDPILAAYDLLNIDLAPVQRIVLRDMWFKNFVITVASRGFGKSSSTDSLIYVKDKGLLYLYELLPPIPDYLNSGDDDVIKYNELIYTSNGFRETRRAALEKSIKGFKIITKSGFVHKGSYHHKLLTFTSDCEFKYKTLYELRRGDKICIQRGQYVFGKYKISSEYAYSLGLSIGNNDNIEVPIIIRCGTEDVQRAFLKGYFEANSIIKDGTIVCLSEYYKFLKEIQLMLLNFGIVARIYNDKIRSAYILIVISRDALLFNKFIGFGSIEKSNILNKYFATKKVGIDTDIIPYALKLCNDVIQYYNDIYLNYTKPDLSIVCNSNNNLTYMGLYKFLKQCKFIENSGFSLDGVRNILDKLRSIFYTHYFFDTVELIDEWEGDCYDFEMDMDSNCIEPNYFANGFINHNTFLLGVNAVLHALLYPGYRIGLISPSFRQCLVLNDDTCTFWTNKGMYSSTNELYDNINIGDKIYSLIGHNTIRNKWVNDNQSCIKIECEKGFELSGSKNHRVLVFYNGKFKYKNLKDLNYGDFVVLKGGMNYFGNDNSIDYSDDFPKEMTKDLAYILGLLVGDGYLESDNVSSKNYRISFSSSDKELIDKFICVIKDMFDINTRIKKYNNNFIVDITNKKLFEFFKFLGCTNTTASDKKIPYKLRECTKEVLIEFIKGLYDTDGCCYVIDNSKYKSCSIEYVSTSLRLCKELQAILLNIGIISSCRLKEKAKRIKFYNGIESNCKEVYKLSITGTQNILKFYELIGFNLTRKQNILRKYINNITKPAYNDVIPYSFNIVMKIFDELEMTYGINRFDFIAKNKYYKRTNFSRIQLHKLFNELSNFDIDSEYINALKFVLDNQLFFVRVKNKINFDATTIDIEVDNEHCYWSSGFISHNSKMIFSEVDKIYQRSSIVREACEKKPVRGADICYLQFKGTERSNGSYIEALPLGVDGAKIRGSRFYLIEIDELAQMPSDILDLVIRPMAAVSLEPMQRVRELERQQELIRAGLATKEDFIDNMANKMIMTSSGYFKFNHMWTRMKSYWKAIDDGEDDKYAVHQIPYTLLPEGFLDEENIREAKRTMSTLEFLMEYEAQMISDSSGFYKASLIEQCSTNTGFTVDVLGKKDKEYVLGVDPNQAGRAAAGIIVIEIGKPSKIVYTIQLHEKTTQDNVKRIQQLINNFNIIGIYMDSMGGGKAWRDLLQDGYDDNEPIIDVNDKDAKHIKGKRILHLVNPTPQWISDANFNLLALFENKELLFPEVPLSANPQLEKIYDEVKVLKSQLVNIVVTQTARGVTHFDTPKRDQNKDLYSALVLAAWGIKDLKRKSSEDEQVLHYKGLVRPHSEGAKFNIMSKQNSIYKGALLRKN